MLVKYQDTEIYFLHVVKPRLKRMSISINSRNEVVVKTPVVDEARVVELVLSKAEWILKKLSLPREDVGGLEFKDGALIPYLGQRMVLKLIKDESFGVGKPKLSFDGSCFTIIYNPFLMKDEYFEKAFDSFYKQEASNIMTKLTEEWADLMKLEYRKISFRKAKSRWGSCTSSGNIMFNYEAIKLPMEFVEYLVVHELSHLKHGNHSQAFWDFVEVYIPDYKAIRLKMKEYRL